VKPMRLFWKTERKKRSWRVMKIECRPGGKDIEAPKSSPKMLIFPNKCLFGSKFWIRLDETDAFLVNMHSKCSPGTRMEPCRRSRLK